MMVYNVLRYRDIAFEYKVDGNSDFIQASSTRIRDTLYNEDSDVNINLRRAQKHRRFARRAQAQSESNKTTFLRSAHRGLGGLSVPVCLTRTTGCKLKQSSAGSEVGVGFCSADVVSDLLSERLCQLD